MSIELENPKSILGKVDAAANYVAQIRMASTIGDQKHVLECVEKAARLLADATSQAETVESALEKIAIYDEQPIWQDDRDDAANDMLRIARVALGTEEE